ncbi:MAG TPA: M48 family peptidase, partial [candidate division Zixibacteria bacterium]|nr:M48 family peptidase [candidate division Zixibacteria bacterium]
MKIDKLIRSKRKTIGLQIAPDATLVVRAPKSAKIADIETVVFRHIDWIRRKKEYVLKNRNEIPVRQFIDGEEFPYLGRSFKLSISDSHWHSLVFDDGFYLSQKYQPQARQLFIKWYKLQARGVISQRVQLLATKANLHYGRIKITSANRRWGSCSAKGNLNFSWRLILAPLEAVDYVVAHELAHLEVKNHSRRFWDKVRELYPDYERWRRWLR